MKRVLVWSIALFIWAGNSNGSEVQATSTLTTQEEQNLLIAQKTLHQIWNTFFPDSPPFRIETDRTLISSENVRTYKSDVFINYSRRIIFFDKDLLKSSSQLTIERAVEHELMHYLFELHLPKRVVKDFRTLFCELHGMQDFGAYARERFFIINTGNLPPEMRAEYHLTQNYRDAKENFFFAFIAEHNYFRDHGAGHPYDDPYEFGASFLHSVQHADDFLDNLDRKLHIYASGTSRFLTQKEKAQIIDHYHMLTYMIYYNLKLSGKKPQLTQYFKNKWKIFSLHNNYLLGEKHQNR